MTNSTGQIIISSCLSLKGDGYLSLTESMSGENQLEGCVKGTLPVKLDGDGLNVNTLLSKR